MHALDGWMGSVTEAPTRLGLGLGEAVTEARDCGWVHNKSSLRNL